MLKVVVYDGGYGGEIFADKLEEELPVLNVIRVISWRNSEKILKNPYLARRVAVKDLKPYIGRVDLIILANQLLSVTSLKYFKRKFKNQKFTGLKLPQPDVSLDRRTVILTTKAFSHTINHYNYLFRLRNKHIADTLCLDYWVPLIDDGELTSNMVRREFERFERRHHYRPNEVILACSHFSEAEPHIRRVLSQRVRVYDGFQDSIRVACRILKIRGGTGRKCKK